MSFYFDEPYVKINDSMDVKESFWNTSMLSFLYILNDLKVSYQ